MTSLYTGAPEKRNLPCTFISCTDVAKCRRFTSLVKKKSKKGRGVGNDGNVDKRTIVVQAGARLGIRSLEKWVNLVQWTSQAFTCRDAYSVLTCIKQMTNYFTLFL